MGIDVMSEKLYEYKQAKVKDGYWTVVISNTNTVVESDASSCVLRHGHMLNISFMLMHEQYLCQE